MTKQKKQLKNVMMSFRGTELEEKLHLKAVRLYNKRNTEKISVSDLYRKSANERSMAIISMYSDKL